MAPGLIAEFTTTWGATIVTTACPDLLLDDPDWAAISANCVLVGGDAFNYICQTLAQEGAPEETTTVAAFYFPGSAARRFVAALRGAGASCHL
eukprot:9319428-Lingulodinium_polyedra.AAC.1